VVKSGFVVSKSTVSIQKKIYTLQDPDKMVYHALHGLTQETNETDGFVTGSEGVILTSLRVGITTVALQVTGTEFSFLHMDSK
jgi:hypothetical protein